MEEITKLEDKIIRRIFEDNKCTAHFDYLTEKKKINPEVTPVLILTTFNPSHGQNFLFGKFSGETKEDCLLKALDFLGDKKELSSYTIEWTGVPYKLEQSYFMGSSMLDALTKFYHGKDKEKFTVYNCKLNPIA